MIRKLYERSFAIQKQILVSYLARGIVYESSSSCSFRLSMVAPVQSVQRISFCTFKFDKQLDVEEKIKPNDEINPNALVLQKKLNFTTSEAIEVSKVLTTNCDTVNLQQVIGTVKWLKKIGATSSVIVKNCHVLLIPKECLKRSYERLKHSKWEKVDDFVPLLMISDQKIRNIQKYEFHSIRNRIYLFKESFLIETAIISHYCSKHTFLFDIELELLKKKLNMLLTSNVSPENILRDLNVLARAEDVIKDRLDCLKKFGITHVMPWMVKCPDQVLQRAIEIRNSTGTTVQKRTFGLLTKRLHWHGKTAISMFRNNIFLRELNYAEASELLDELEKIYSPSEISANIYLLSRPIHRVKIRVAELISLKRHVPPQVLNMNERDFKKYLNHNRDT